MPTEDTIHLGSGKKQEAELIVIFMSLSVVIVQMLVKIESTQLQEP